ncbi:DUF2147 domain-containing protein [Undibacterium sp. RTI2.1]|uniref:DUF2147 domain-containing protein n=1 Tax=unclassified Undibacterium TaxID=2630295 RepID=UPI002B23A6F2|nr:MULTISPECIES: DUF2147 domain-containing protein [unclassified Undibacterium]MEB0032790.1 DUF2147 domain-containing protein [Undibacterium sp. RTI2.1]MEB0118529.1 DUF2147 domain-containing protein [Undibacterium sp. RTI2.2]
MKKYALFIVGSFLSLSALAENMATGKWQQYDDKTGALQSIMRIEKEGDSYVGFVDQRFVIPGQSKEDGEPLCTRCTGDIKDKPKLGLKIMTGFKRDGTRYDHGSILDINSGKTYSCEMALSDDGQTLTVRGYIGISLLGRSQTWRRLAP